MVIVSTLAVLAQDAGQSLIERLDQPRRLAVVMALLGIVLAGIFLVACAIIGARWVRRLARRGVGTTSVRHSENERLRRALAGLLPEVGTDETVSIDATTDETRIDPPPSGT